MARVGAPLRWLLRQLTSEPAPRPGMQPASFTYFTSGRPSTPAKKNARTRDRAGRSSHGGTVHEQSR